MRTWLCDVSNNNHDHGSSRCKATVQGEMMSDKNAGVTSSKIKFCDLKCEYASFPREDNIDGSKSCRTFVALWCELLSQNVTKNAPCAAQFGMRRPKTGF